MSRSAGGVADMDEEDDVDHHGQDEDALLVNEDWRLEVGDFDLSFPSSKIAVVYAYFWIVEGAKFLIWRSTVVNNSCNDA